MEEGVEIQDPPVKDPLGILTPHKPAPVSDPLGILTPKKKDLANAPEPTWPLSTVGSKPSQTPATTDIPGFRKPNIVAPEKTDYSPFIPTSTPMPKQVTKPVAPYAINPLDRSKLKGARLLTKDEDNKMFGGNVKVIPAHGLESQQNNPVDIHKNQWGNIGVFLPQTILGGLEKDAGDAITYFGNKFVDTFGGGPTIGMMAKQYTTDLGLKLEGYGQAHQDVAGQNALPNTVTGKVVSTATGFVPDLIELAATPELDVAKLGKVGELLTKYGGKYAPKAAAMAGGKFPILMGTKGLTSGYTEGKAQGMSDYAATNHGLVKSAEEYGKGLLFEGAGAAAGKVSDIGIKALEDAGWMKGGKILEGAQKKILHSAAQATAFSAVPFITNAVQGKGTSLDEIRDNAVFGGLLGLFHGPEAKEPGKPTAADGSANQMADRSPLIDLHNFMVADIDAIKTAHEIEVTPTDLTIKAAVHADNAFNETDPESQQQQIVQSSLNSKLSSVKSVTQAILKDKDGFEKAINELPIGDEDKAKMIEKANQVYKELDPLEQQKTALAKQITDLQGEPTGDLIKDKERQVKIKDLNKQLDDIITKQYEDSKSPAAVPVEVPKEDATGNEAAVDNTTNEKPKDYEIGQKLYNENGDEFLIRGKYGAHYDVENRTDDNKPHLSVTAEDLSKENLSNKSPITINENKQLNTENDETSNESSSQKDGEKGGGEESGTGGEESGTDGKKGNEENDAEKNGVKVTGGDEPPVIKQKGGKENAIKKISQQESGGTEHKERGSGGKTETPSNSDSAVSPEKVPRQKAIDAVTHDVLYSRHEKNNGYSPRFDFGMKKVEKDRAVRDIKAGKYDTPAAKKMLDKIQEWENDGHYPIIEGSGGHASRGKSATPEEIQAHINDAKANKANEFTKSEIHQINKDFEEYGVTYDELKAHRDYEQQQKRNEGGKATSPADNNAKTVQQPENDGAGNAGKDRPGESAKGGKSGSGEAEATKPVKQSLTGDELARKLELRKKFLNRLNDITNIPTLLADKEFREYAGLVFKEAAGDFRAFSSELIESVGEKIKEHLPGLFKELGGKLPEDKERIGGNEVKKTILTKRAYEGDVQPDVKDYLEKKGLKRLSFSQEERSGQATDFINKFGDDAAFRAVEAGDIDGGLAASVLAQLQIKNSRLMENLPMDSDARNDLAQKQADNIALMEKKGYLGGEFNGQLAHEYQNAELDFANIKKMVEVAQKKAASPEQLKKIKEITAENERLKNKLKEAEGKLIEATDKEFKTEPDPPKGETKSTKAKRVADKLRQAKIHRPNVFSSATPASLVWDTAIETVAKSIEAGGKIADAIDKGIDHIKGTDWYKNLSSSKKAEAEREFKRFNHDNVGSTDLEDLQSRFVDKTDNKFTTSEAKDIWGYMKESYLNNGSSYSDALAKTAQDLGLSWRQVSEAVVTPKLKRMSDEMWKRNSELARNRSAIKTWIGQQESSAPVRAWKKISGVMRGIATFGHGHIFLGTHAGMTFFNPSTWHKTIPAFFRGFKLAYGKEANYEKAMQELKNEPNYLIAQRAGLKNDPDRINVEEYQKSQQFLGKLGHVGERGFNTIKVLRQNLFDYHFNRLSAAERDDPEVAKSIAQLVNLVTGATNLKLPSWVNEVSFAGGMEAARWEKLLKSPAKSAGILAKVIKGNATPAERVFAKVWARRVGEQLATYTAGLVVNAAINNYLYPDDKKKLFDPTDPGWWKYKFGKHTIDPTSGMRSTAAFIGELVTTPFKTKAENYGKSGLKAEAENVEGYARGKLSPLYGTIADFVDKKDFSQNVMPSIPHVYNTKPERPSKGHETLTWAQYGTQKLPLPLAEAFGVAYQSALDHGANQKHLNAVMDGIISGVISGGTGFRVGESKDKKGGMKKQAVYGQGHN